MQMKIQKILVVVVHVGCSQSPIARYMAHAPNTFYCRGALGTRVNPDIIGRVWTGEF